MSAPVLQIIPKNVREANILKKALTAYSICLEKSGMEASQDYLSAQTWLKDIQNSDWS